MNDLTELHQVTFKHNFRVWKKYLWIYALLSKELRKKEQFDGIAFIFCTEHANAILHMSRKKQPNLWRQKTSTLPNPRVQNEMELVKSGVTDMEEKVRSHSYIFTFIYVSIEICMYTYIQGVFCDWSYEFF